MDPPMSVTSQSFRGIFSIEVPFFQESLASDKMTSYAAQMTVEQAHSDVKFAVRHNSLQNSGSQPVGYSPSGKPLSSKVCTL